MAYETKTYPTSIRLTEEEQHALQACANIHNTTPSALIRKAALALAAKLGTTPRPAPGNTKGAKKDKTPVTAQLCNHDIEALHNFQQYNKYSSIEAAAQSAIRTGLELRGYLQYPEYSYPCDEIATERGFGIPKQPDAHPVVIVPANPL